MIKYNIKIKEVEVEELVGITCDRCKTTFDAKDYIETQEFHHINFSGGFGSVFGDGSIVEADICQKCLLELIKDFMRVS